MPTSSSCGGLWPRFFFALVSAACSASASAACIALCIAACSAVIHDLQDYGVHEGARVQVNLGRYLVSPLVHIGDALRKERCPLLEGVPYLKVYLTCRYPSLT